MWSLLCSFLFCLAAAAPVHAKRDPCGHGSLVGVNVGFPLVVGARFGPVFGYQPEAPDYRFALAVDVGLGGAKVSLANRWVFSGVYCTPVTSADGRTGYRGKDEPSFWGNTAVSVDLTATYTWIHHRWRRAVYVGPEISFMLLGGQYIELMVPWRFFIGLGVPVAGASDRFAVLPTAGVGASW